MENAAIILIAVTLFILVIIMGLLSVLILKMFRNQAPLPPTQSKEEAENSAVQALSKAEYHPAIQERLKDIEKIKNRRAELFCPNHPDEPGETVCAICDKLYCRACIKPFKTLHFCKEHLPLIMKYEWDEVLTIKTSTEDPEHGVRLYDFKKELFENEDIPTYVETHYKINVDHDHIETYLVMYGIRENVETLKNKLNEAEL